MELEYTPTQLESHERSKRFRASIAKRAAEISPEAQLRALMMAPPPPKPKPPVELLPVQNAAIADAAAFAFLASWKHEIAHIIEVVARDFNVSLADILSLRRDQRSVKPRHIAMYLSKEMTTRSLPDIGRRFGGKDHTTILHAVKKIGRLIEQDAELAGRIEKIKAAL